MNKRITVIIIAVLVVLLAAILIVVGVKSCDGKKEDGYDDLNVSVSDDDIGEVYDVETGEVVEDSNSSGSNTNSSGAKEEIKVPETVDEGYDSSEGSSSSSATTSSGSSSSSGSSNGGTGSSSSSGDTSSSEGGTNKSSLEGYQALQPI